MRYIGFQIQAMECVALIELFSVCARMRGRAVSLSDEVLDDCTGWHRLQNHTRIGVAVVVAALIERRRGASALLRRGPRGVRRQRRAVFVGRLLALQQRRHRCARAQRHEGGVHFVNVVSKFSPSESDLFNAMQGRGLVDDGMRPKSNEEDLII